MNVYIFTAIKTVLIKHFPKDVQFIDLAAISKHSPEEKSLSYIDVSSLNDAEIKKNITKIKKRSKDISWGIIDQNGSINDPAALFFEGACDYLGPGFFKKSKTIDPKRFKEAIEWRVRLLNAAPVSAPAVEKVKTKKTAEKSVFFKNEVKLPSSNVFPGWKKIQTGKVLPFYLLYCSMQGKTALDTRFGEKSFAQIHKRFLSLLVNNFSEADGLLWMDTGKNCLFLLPPKAKSAEAVLESCMRMIISAPLITMESLGLSVPVNFIFALHYGSLSYKPPGKTGTVVSDAVNFIFHLGAKKAEAGRLTISDEIPDVSIPASLEDCFVSAGEYEGRKIMHSKKFSYEKLWV